MFLQANPDRARPDIEKEELAKVYRPGMSVLPDAEAVRMRRRRSRRRRRHESMQRRQQQADGRGGGSFLDVDDEEEENDATTGASDIIWGDSEDFDGEDAWLDELNGDESGEYDSDEADRMVLEQVRELSLRQAGFGAERADGDTQDDDSMLQVPYDAPRSRSLDEGRGAAVHAAAEQQAQIALSDDAPPSSRFSASTIASTTSDRGHRHSQQRYRSSTATSGLARSVSPVSRSNRSSRSSRRMQQHRLSQQQQRRQEQQRQQPTARQIEHQASLRSLLSASEIDSQEIEEEIMRQVIEEGLLDGIDLRNIDASQENEIRERIAQAYQRRMGERERARERRSARERERDRERDRAGRERQDAAGATSNGPRRPSHDYSVSSSTANTASTHRRQRSENNVTSRATHLANTTGPGSLGSNPPPPRTSSRTQQQQQSHPSVSASDDQRTPEQQRRHRDYDRGQHHQQRRHRSSSQGPPSLASRAERRTRTENNLPRTPPAAMSMESVVLPRAAASTATAPPSTMTSNFSRRRGSEQTRRTTDPESTLTRPDLMSRRDGQASGPTAATSDLSSRSGPPAPPVPGISSERNFLHHQNTLPGQGSGSGVSSFASPPAIHVPSGNISPRHAAARANAIDVPSQPSPLSLSATGSAASSPGQQATRSSPLRPAGIVGPPSSTSPSSNATVSSAISSLPSQQRQQVAPTTPEGANSTHANTDTAPILYHEPFVSCSRCEKSNIQYDLHYVCSTCPSGVGVSAGSFALCMACYRAGKGCLHWYGFGYAAWVKYERLVQATATGGSGGSTVSYGQGHDGPPHVLMGRRYVKAKPSNVVKTGGRQRREQQQQQQQQQQQRRRLLTEDPASTMQTGLFCDVCQGNANKCYWRCEICNSGAWGFCNFCVNQGRCCTHALLPLMVTVKTSEGPVGNAGDSARRGGGSTVIETASAELPTGQIEQQQQRQRSSGRSGDTLQVPSRARAPVIQQQQQQQAEAAAAAATLPAGFLGNSAIATTTSGLPLSSPIPYGHNGTSLPSTPTTSSFTIRTLTFTVSCDLCRYPIPPSLPRFHCQVCSNGDYDICMTCYNGLVTSGQLSVREGADGWRICPAKRHRMCIVGFEERIGGAGSASSVGAGSAGNTGGTGKGRYRFVVKEIVGGWAMKDEDVEVIMNNVNNVSVEGSTGVDGVSPGSTGRPGRTVSEASGGSTSSNTGKRRKEKKWEWRDNDGTVRKMTMGIGVGSGVGAIAGPGLNPGSGPGQPVSSPMTLTPMGIAATSASASASANTNASVNATGHSTIATTPTSTTFSNTATTAQLPSPLAPSPLAPPSSSTLRTPTTATTNTSPTPIPTSTSTTLNPSPFPPTNIPPLTPSPSTSSTMPMPTPIPPSGGTGFKVVALWSYFPNTAASNASSGSGPNSNSNSNPTSPTSASSLSNTNNNITNTNNTSKEDDELSFPRAAEIREVVDINGDWCWGRYAGRVGLFPGAFGRVVG